MNTPQNDCTKLDEGDLRVYDNYVPVIGIGDYILNVTQRVNPKNVADPIDQTFLASQPFSVEGPRYALPAEDLYSTFPPDQGVGVFDQFFPNVVLTKRDLPWENNIFDDTDRTRQTPWMALLLFVEDEPALLAPAVDGWVPNRVMSASITAADFYTTVNGKRTGKSGPDAKGILWPELESVWYESDDFLAATPCTVIDVDPLAFYTMIPVKNDLRYLAHARQVDVSDKDTNAIRIAPDGWYSVVVGNRLPDEPPPGSGQPGKRNIVHLVSLEGFEKYIGDDANVPTPQGTKYVRMISFKSWSFTCLPELGESFAELMVGLLQDGQGNQKSTSFTLPTTGPTTTGPEVDYATQVIAKGYVPIRYQTRLGEETFGWYRGPFSPVPVQNFISKAGLPWAPFTTASSALIYDKTYGVFDLSYGVAWETGRLLALANSHFGQELLDWQRDGHQALDLIMERKRQIPALATFSTLRAAAAGEQTLIRQIAPYSVTDNFMTYLVTKFAGNLSAGPADDPDPPCPKMTAYADLPPVSADPQTITDLLQEPDVQQAMRTLGAQELDDITDTLAQWYMLSGVPFEALVPHAGLLPPESVKFFYLDSNWLDALIEGALSIGIESSRDVLYQDLMKDQIWNATHTTVQTLRDQLLGPAASTVPPGTTTPLDQEAISGMLLRSAVVSGWPGMEISAYLKYTRDAKGNAVPDEDSKIKALRIERLSPDVMLVLWPTVPAAVSIDEPNEGVAFGFEDPPPGKGEGYYLYLRSLATDKYGMPMPADPKYQIDAVGAKLIDPNSRIVSTSKLVSAIGTALGVSVGIRDFAVQMIKVPEQAVFAAPANP